MPARSVTSGPWRIPPTNRRRAVPQALFLSLVLLFSSCARSIDPPQRFFARLETLKEAKDYRVAVDFVKGGLKRHPNSGRLWVALGEIEFLQGDFKQAKESLLQAHEKRWISSSLYPTLGMSHFYLGEFDQARSFLERAVDLDPTDRKSAKALAYSSFYLGDGRQALELFRRLAADPVNDTEARAAADALKALGDRWEATEMVWITHPESGLQLAYPGSWVKQVKERLGPAGKMTTLTISNPPPTQGGALRLGWALILAVIQNASLQPLPQEMTGPWRRGEKEQRYEIRYATKPGASMGYQTIPRDPEVLAKRLSLDFLKRIPEGGRDIWVNPWTGRRGEATYCLGRAAGENAYGESFVGYSMGIYDPTSDTFSSLVLYGPYEDRSEVEPTALAIFNLAIFGGVVGIPPAAQAALSADDYRNRIGEFLKRGQASRALTETQQALTSFPKNPEFYEFSGLAQQALGQVEEAWGSFQKARSLGVSHLGLELSIGELGLRLGKLSEAEAAFLRALEFDRKRERAVWGYAKALIQQKKFSKAIEFLGSLSSDVSLPEQVRYRYYLEALQLIDRGSPSELVRGFHPQGEESFFLVPAGWAQYELIREPNRYGILFTRELLQIPDAQFEVGVLYLRYEQAGRRVGKTQPEPEEILETFFNDMVEKIADPRKTVQSVDPPYRRGVDRYRTATLTYTEGMLSRMERWLFYYEAARDRLHALGLRSAGPDGGQWSPFADALFDTADFS